MDEIGVRELKARLSSVLRQVDAGEAIRVTSRGRPVADIVPAAARRGEERLRALVAAGRVTPAARPHPRRTPRPLSTERSASALVLAERDAGR
ncbi:MAG TPA: type II toxin-antitoxin system prevent-host-death family antitoxin [Solirubrobacterales bacterium]|jgi:prevent-host-death family protein|nr:type II toxin-antitoxin system prevent-host-death family antitoxin [Solirubrobacterales bacterium]